MWSGPVTIRISRMPASTSLRTGWKIIGSRPTGSRGLFVTLVSGKSRDPVPPPSPTPPRSGALIACGRRVTACSRDLAIDERGKRGGPVGTGEIRGDVGRAFLEGRLRDQPRQRAADRLAVGHPGADDEAGTGPGDGL